MKYDENDFLAACALRFDGWKYWKNRCRHFAVESNNLIPLTENLLKTREFYAEQLDNFASFFALQRFLGKWGGEYLTVYSDEHIIFRLLFLHLYRDEVPPEFRFQDYDEIWRRKYAPIRENLAAPIRRAFRRVGRGAKIKI